MSPELQEAVEQVRRSGSEGFVQLASLCVSFC
jgi:hypothetical protein